MEPLLLTVKKKRNVLVVDDEQINRELLEAILSMQYRVSTATCGTEAMDMLRAAEEPYSLLLLDILMPKMSGFQVIEACKADKKLRDLPIIVMTSEKSAEMRSIRLGADDFITKPYRMPEVILARCERIVELSEEKQLIRSIEKDKTTGLYIPMFFNAYIRRVLPGLRREADAVVLTADGLGTDAAQREEQLAALAQLFTDDFIGTRGLGCRAENDALLALCMHQNDYPARLAQLNAALAAAPVLDGVRLQAGVCERIDKTAPPESWFETARANVISV